MCIVTSTTIVGIESFIPMLCLVSLQSVLSLLRLFISEAISHLAIQFGSFSVRKSVSSTMFGSVTPISM